MRMHSLMLSVSLNPPEEVSQNIPMGDTFEILSFSQFHLPSDTYETKQENENRAGKLLCY